VIGGAVFVGSLYSCTHVAARGHHPESRRKLFSLDKNSRRGDTAPAPGV
jgi:hypothetical protein